MPDFVVSSTDTNTEGLASAASETTADEVTKEQERDKDDDEKKQGCRPKDHRGLTCNQRNREVFAFCLL